MKNKYLTLLLLIAVLPLATQAQNDKDWSFEAGVTAVNLFPVGEEAPQGEYFDEFFNLNDHYNFGFYVGVSKHFSNRWSLSARASTATISKWGEFGEVDESVLVDNLKYYGLDAMVNFNILKEARLNPYVGLGGGYTWIEEGPFNTFSLNNGTDNLVGAGTVNGALGVNYKLTDQFGLKLETLYKHVFEDYLPKHWQHSLSITYNFGMSKSEEEEPLDSDGDGVADAQDLCPDQAGEAIFAGCPDSDGDGIPDSLDKCPNVKNTDASCSTKAPQQTTQIQEQPKPKEVTYNRALYFELKSAELDNNAKEILDAIISASKDADRYTISVSGHADATGTEGFNNKLSEQRAMRVKSYMVANGINENQINTSYFGESQPKADNTTAKGRALNRRAEMVITITTTM